MGAGHSHALFVHEHSSLHQMAPEAKLVGAFGMVVAFAITPRQALWAFAAYAVLVLTLLYIGRIPLRFLVVRLAAVLPFILFAFLIPFVATGETTNVWGLELSVDGLWGAWNVLVKAILGASVSIVLTATTEVPDILRGMGVLRVPPIFTSIATFMIRYLELVVDELGRIRVAMTARGYDPRWLHQARPIAASAGAMFVRSYERGERIHAAMLARGFTGEMPVAERESVGWRQWAAVAGLLFVTSVISGAALVMS